MAARFSKLETYFYGSSIFLITLTVFAFAIPLEAVPQEASAPSQPATPLTRPVGRTGLASRDTAAHEPSISEEEIRQKLIGKSLFLRGGYSENSLRFDAAGRLASPSPSASYSLSLIEIGKVRLEKHKLELQGVRYGLHFTGYPTSGDLLSSADKVRITPKKKVVTITIDRESVAGGKSENEKGKKKSKGGMKIPAAVQESATEHHQPGSTMAGEAGTVTQSNQALHRALDSIFAPGVDEKMIASMPECWRLYYQAADAKTDFRPADPAILRQSAVDQKARLLTTFALPSNDLAQNAGIAGVGSYYVVVSAGGKPAQIVVGRPIGFGLDENAVSSIQQASFQPAVKGGKPVPVLLDLTVQFRIHSNHSGASADQLRTDATAQESAPLPGPYSTNQPAGKPQ